MPQAIARSTAARSPRVHDSETCRCSAELMPNSSRNWKKPNPQAKRYAPAWSGPIAWRTSRVVQRTKTACSGVRSASQNVPLSRRPSTGGKARAPGIAVAVVTGPFLGERQ